LDLVETLAEALHDGWCDALLEAGWQLGARDPSRRTHPHLLPWAQCPPETNDQDRRIARLVIAHLRAYQAAAGGGEPSEEQLAEAIHEAWADATRAEGRTDHPHLHDRWADHADERRAEHLHQARRILAIRRACQKRGA